MLMGVTIVAVAVAEAVSCANTSFVKAVNTSITAEIRLILFILGSFNDEGMYLKIVSGYRIINKMANVTDHKLQISNRAKAFII